MQRKYHAFRNAIKTCLRNYAPVSLAKSFRISLCDGGPKTREPRKVSGRQIPGTRVSDEAFPWPALQQPIPKL